MRMGTVFVMIVVVCMIGMRCMSMVMPVVVAVLVIVVVMRMGLSIKRRMQGQVDNFQGQRIQGCQHACWHPKCQRGLFDGLCRHPIAQERQGFVHDSGDGAVLIDIRSVRMIMVRMIMVMVMAMTVVVIVVVVICRWVRVLVRVCRHRGLGAATQRRHGPIIAPARLGLVSMR